MKYQVVGLDYGCEVGPTLAYLRTTFPEVAFETFEANWSVTVETACPANLEALRSVASAFRDGFTKGYSAGYSAKENER